MYCPLARSTCKKAQNDAFRYPKRYQKSSIIGNAPYPYPGLPNTTFFLDNARYWASIFKYRKRRSCALGPECWCCCRVPLPDVWLCALWSLGAGAAAGCRCQMCGCVCFGAWALELLQGAAARCVAMCALELGRWCRYSGAAYSCLLLSGSALA